MIITSLVIRDFQCFAGEHVIELAPGVNVIIGENDAGKTALLEAMAWCFFGARALRRGVLDDDVVHDGARSALVEVMFDDGSSVLRARPRGGPVTLRVGEAGGERRDARSADVAQLLGVDRKGYQDLVHVAQRSVGALASSASSRRREVLLGALDDGSWSRLSADVERLLTDARSALERHRGALEGLSVVGETRLAEDVTRDLESARVADQVLAEHQARERAAEQRRHLVGELRDVKRTLVRPEPDTVDCEDERERHYRARGEVRRLRVLAEVGFDGDCPVVGARCPSTRFVRDNLVDAVRSFQSAMNEETEARENLAEVEQRAQKADNDRRERERSRRRWNEGVVELRALPQTAVEQYDIDDLERRARRIDDLVREAAAVEATATSRERLAILEVLTPEIETEVRALELLVRGARVVPGPAAAARDDVEDAVAALLIGLDVVVRVDWEVSGRGGAGRCRCGVVFEGSTRRCPDCRRPRSRARGDEVTIEVDRAGRSRPVESCGGLGDVVCLALILAAAWVGGRMRASFRLLDEVGVHLKGANLSHLNDMLDRVGVVGVGQVILATNRSHVTEQHAQVIEVAVEPDGSRSIRSR